jgi:hypothetical protein
VNAPKRVPDSTDVDPWDLDSPFNKIPVPPFRVYAHDFFGAVKGQKERILFQICHPSREYKNVDWIVEAQEIPPRPPWLNLWRMTRMGKEIVRKKWQSVHAPDSLLLAEMFREACVRLVNVDAMRRAQSK